MIAVCFAERTQTMFAFLFLLKVQCLLDFRLLLSDLDWLSFRVSAI